ncbi:hypothetical protein DLAC_06906 [Tieghemostelium lacteum]|uniref:Metallo-beta-lactamase domain-containing protein n=1 Tax=Tieghemostelium lacteum TaxID=361077 RepID=A0A151ZDN2_TIELA|nr:hypothetical protein DLAC_06906 [Tieghemostelium lacteum]|eukprot:KYQ92068.1 hypothetical protein DLAC_06906 [Tieghemostelium lacteum]
MLRCLVVNSCRVNTNYRYFTSNTTKKVITFVPPIDIEKKISTPSKMNFYSNYICWNEKNNECLLIQNNEREEESDLYSRKEIEPVPYGFLGFPITKELNNDGLQNIGKQAFYLGSLVTPYYLGKLSRNQYNYYLVNIKGDESEKVSLERHLVKTNNSRTQWTTADKVLQSFRQCLNMVTPETKYMLQLLDQLHLALNKKNIQPESDDTVGCQVPLEYAPNIESVPIRSNTLIPFNTTNLIVSIDKNEALFIDPGANTDGATHFKNYIEEKLKNKSLSKDSKVYIFITHNHKDHWEGIGILLHYFPQATLIAHPNTIETIPYDIVNKQAVKGSKLEINCLDTTSSDNIITVGDRQFLIISTPGHTSDSLSLFEPKSKTLIAGDHLVGWGSSILDFDSGDMKDYMDSTRDIIKYLQPKIALPAHGPSNYSPVVLLNNYLKHRQSRENEILDAYNAGNTSLNDILKVVYQNIDPKLERLARGNIHLHLTKLQKDSKIPPNSTQ